MHFVASESKSRATHYLSRLGFMRSAAETCENQKDKSRNRGVHTGTVPVQYRSVRARASVSRFGSEGGCAIRVSVLCVPAPPPVVFEPNPRSQNGSKTPGRAGMHTRKPGTGSSTVQYNVRLSGRVCGATLSFHSQSGRFHVTKRSSRRALAAHPTLERAQPQRAQHVACVP